MDIVLIFIFNKVSKMPKGSAALTNARREEIINACAQLYETMPFKDITIKEIGNVTTFTRTSIYNYFETKEEIFLALLDREYTSWADHLQTIFDQHETLTKDELADKIANTISGRVRMLKLLSMNLFEMEEHSRLESLVKFKYSFKRTRENMRNLIVKFCPEKTDEEVDHFMYSFFPFIFGIYPYTVVSPKQREALAKAEIPFKYLSIYEITYNSLKQLL